MTVNAVDKETETQNLFRNCVVVVFAGFQFGLFSCVGCCICGLYWVYEGMEVMMWC